MTATEHSSAAATQLSELHLLLSYQCNYECDHCFVWSGPSVTGTMNLDIIDHILNEAEQLGTIRWIYFEGGEPFRFYEILRNGVLHAREKGFKVGIVTNAFWAKSEEDALEWLKPLAGLIDDFSISSDNYHGGNDQPKIAREAARALGIPVDFISVAEPGAAQACGNAGKLPPGESAVLYRGRAAAVLASKVPPTPWREFTSCPWEDLRHPARVHVDPFGHLHICQGISIGNLLEQPLTEIMANFKPDEHPIVGPLLKGGPAEIVRHYELEPEDGYADHCHLCYESRRALRSRLPDILTPNQMYGEA